MPIDFTPQQVHALREIFAKNPDLVFFLKSLQEKDYRAWLTGGVITDLILQKTEVRGKASLLQFKDIDFLTTAPAEIVQETQLAIFSKNSLTTTVITATGVSCDIVSLNQKFYPTKPNAPWPPDNYLKTLFFKEKALFIDLRAILSAQNTLYIYNPFQSTMSDTNRCYTPIYSPDKTIDSSNQIVNIFRFLDWQARYQHQNFKEILLEKDLLLLIKEIPALWKSVDVPGKMRISRILFYMFSHYPQQSLQILEQQQLHHFIFSNSDPNYFNKLLAFLEIYQKIYQKHDNLAEIGLDSQLITRYSEKIKALQGLFFAFAILASSQKEELAKLISVNQDTFSTKIALFSRNFFVHNSLLPVIYEAANILLKPENLTHSTFQFLMNEKEFITQLYKLLRDEPFSQPALRENPANQPHKLGQTQSQEREKIATSFFTTDRKKNEKALEFIIEEPIFHSTFETPASTNQQPPQSIAQPKPKKVKVEKVKKDSELEEKPHAKKSSPKALLTPQPSIQQANPVQPAIPSPAILPTTQTTATQKNKSDASKNPPAASSRWETLCHELTPTYILTKTGQGTLEEDSFRRLHVFLGILSFVLLSSNILGETEEIDPHLGSLYIFLLSMTMCLLDNACAKYKALLPKPTTTTPTTRSIFSRTGKAIIPLPKNKPPESSPNPSHHL